MTHLSNDKSKRGPMNGNCKDHMTNSDVTRALTHTNQYELDHKKIYLEKQGFIVTNIRRNPNQFY